MLYCIRFEVVTEIFLVVYNICDDFPKLDWALIFCVCCFSQF